MGAPHVPSAIRAAIDRVVPADAWPGGWDGGAAAHLSDDADDVAWSRAPLDALARRLDELAKGSFAALAPDEQDRVLATAASEDAAGVAALRRVAFEGYYAPTRGRTPEGIRMVGFRAVPEGVVPVEPALVPDVGVAGVRS